MTQPIAVRISDEEMELVKNMIELHHKLGHIPEPTASAYLRWLLTRDVAESVQEMEKRRQQVTQG